MIKIESEVIMKKKSLFQNRFNSFYSRCHTVYWCFDFFLSEYQRITYSSWLWKGKNKFTYHSGVKRHHTQYFIYFNFLNLFFSTLEICKYKQHFMTWYILINILTKMSKKAFYDTLKNTGRLSPPSFLLLWCLFF